MGRRKIEIKAIKDDRNRSVTFLKRKGGLFKKAHELSVLTSVDVAVIIFGQNNKLYEYASTANLPDFLQRYQYARNAYGGPHELKGPEDFKDKGDGGDDDDDDDMGDMPHPSPSPPQQAMIPQHALPPHAQQFQRLGGTPSASPPMPNGTFHHHHGTPQPISRPTSRAHIRHPSVPTNMPPGHNLHPQSQQPSYAYQPNPPIYNPQAAAAMQARSQPPPPQYPPQYTSVPQSHQPPHQQQQQSVPQHLYQQEPPRPVPATQIPTSQPPPPTQQDLKPPQIQVPSPEPQQNHFNSPPLPQPKALPASKQHSIFTPIDDNRSTMMRHWGADPASESSKSEFKAEPARSQSLDVNSIKRNMNGMPNGTKPAPTSNPPLMPPQRTISTPSLSSTPQIPPPVRQNSLAKPKLKVQIPLDTDDADEKPTGSDSNTNSQRSNETNHRHHHSNNILTPIREPGLTPGPVLPPPSPSASALLSAGASGPPNPFARPLPPNNNQNNHNNRDMDTPISALPSRFMENGLLPSPSSFYPDWPFGGRDSANGNGSSSNMLPSPLTFQTPIERTGPGFGDELGVKRKLDGTPGAAEKRIKT